MDFPRETRPGRKARNESEAETPHRLVEMVYDLAILACERKDESRSGQAIRLLREVMLSAGPEDSSDLMAFYDWCLDRIRDGEFALAAQTLADLRTAWEKAEQRLAG
jgi:flagellin-specific chaperone FliS